ncbi:MAG: thioredoxin family protein, partial [Candidatus Omnitrophota bacterium]
YADNQVVIGSSEEAVVEVMGEPLGRAVSGDIVMLKYPLVLIRLQDNKVIELRDNKVKEIPAITVGPAIAKPIKKHLVVKKKSSAAKASTVKTKKYKKIEVINEKGKRVDLNALIVPGEITIIDFYAHWCGPCSLISPKLEKLAHKYKNVYLRKVNIGQWKTPVVRQFEIKSVPHIRVYDQDGNMIGTPTYSYKKVTLYIEKLIK